jgi:hypothetical protein
LKFSRLYASGADRIVGDIEMEASDGLTVSRAKTVFVIEEWDVQEMARMRLGRELDEEEMYHVRKAVNWGMEFWYDVVGVAVDQAVEDARERRIALE